MPFRLINAEDFFAKGLKAIRDMALRRIGGVSANSLLRKRLLDLQNEKNYKIFIPPFEYCTDNAAMVAVTGYYKYLQKDFCDLTTTPEARYSL